MTTAVASPGRGRYNDRMRIQTPSPGANPGLHPVITFWGAAQMVTGSMHLIEYGKRKVLLDCGMYQGRREEARLRNAEFPFFPAALDAVLISHSHIDHCGNLPTLVRQGFAGPVYCTSATRDLMKLMLSDSAKIQEEDAAHLNIQRDYAEPWVEPLYTQADVDAALRQCVPVPYGRERELIPGVSFTLLEAGHVLGSAMIHLRFGAEGGGRTVTFTGDLGRRNVPLLRPSAPVPPADLLVCESTYGNRVHDPLESTVENLYKVINKTYDRGGKVLIPAFSLGRCQLILHFLHRGLREGRIPRRPVYVDSPLAADVVEVYRRHPECLTHEAVHDIEEEQNFLGSDLIEFVRDFSESLEISRRPGPCVIIAASGMCDAGRIQEHLKRHVDDPRCSLVLVSFQAPGTVGRRLMEPRPTVRFMGREWNKWIDVVHLEGFSGHADRDDFRAYLGPLVGKVGKVRLIHGERDQAEALAAMLREMGFPDVGIPAPGEQLELA